LDGLKERTERWVGDQFIAWWNARFGSSFTFSRLGFPPAADVEYIDGDQALHVEVTGVYYDDDAARFDNMNARGLPNAPDGWSSLKDDGSVVAIDTSFIESLNQRLAEKSAKSYSDPPVLVVHHTSRFHHSPELLELLNQVTIPPVHPFMGICFLGRMPEGDPQGRIWIRALSADRSIE
jgi:hypothetical protein